MRVGFLSGKIPGGGQSNSTPILLPADSHGHRSLEAVHAESDTTEATYTHAQIIQNDRKSFHGTAFTRTLFPYEITVTGFWN